MSASPLSSSAALTAGEPASLALLPFLTQDAPAAARQVLALLGRMDRGVLDLTLPGGTVMALGRAAPELPRACLQVDDWQVFGEVLGHGDIGLAEAYIAGRWHTPDLPGLLRLLLAHRAELEAAIYGRWWGRAWHHLRHWLRRNSLAGARRNVQAHYDLGNDFYALWLDPGMAYSSAWFGGHHSLPLATAQRRKMERALDAAGVGPGSRVLEIGCGWGGLAEAAARRGAHVTGLTLSTEQLAWARARISSAGQAARCDLRLQDYRLVADGPYDAIVSIEMFEAVGQAWWPSYFANLQRLLRPGGRACIQTISVADGLFERYARGSDFIQQYIFPGGMLPSPARFCAGAEAAGLVVEDELAFGRDYAETLRRWRTAYHARLGEVRQLGYDERFVRTWDFYLAYCEAAFDAGSTDVHQFTLRRP